MRTSKRYSNATFTHRPDREAGRHRGPRAASEPRICRRCRAVYARRRWTSAGTPKHLSLAAIAVPATTLCPACRMVAAKQFGGEVRISGAFVAGHRAEIEHLIRNEVRRAAEDNPLQRLVMLDVDSRNRLIVRTTTEHLAQRLGHALHKALHGTVTYRFSEENKFAHVLWSRD